MKRYLTLLLAAVVGATVAPAAGQVAAASDVPANVPKKGLVAHWAAEGDARDSAGQNHGALKGGATFAPGKFGQAFKLDGKDDYVDFGNPKALQITGSQTIAMWIRPDRLGVEQNLLHKAYGGEGAVTLDRSGQVVYYYGSAGADKEPHCYLYTGGRAGADCSTVGFDIGTRSLGPPVGQTKLKAGQWTHLVSVRDMKTKKLAWYVNGALVVQAQFLGPALAKASPLALYVGKGHVKNYAGLIDDVAIWNRTLTAGEIRAVFAGRLNMPAFNPLANGLVALWLADGNAKDSLGKHHGKAGKGVSYTADRHGGAKGAFLFSGRTGFVEAPDRKELDTDDAFTLSAWINPRIWRVPNTDEPTIVAKWDGTRPGFGDYVLALTVDGRARLLVSPGPKSYAYDPVFSKSAAPKNKWTHLAATFDRGQMKLYINGKLEGNKTSARGKHTMRAEYAHDDVTIGGHWYNQHNFDGAMDDVAIWNRALSAEEIHAIVKMKSLRNIRTQPGFAVAPSVTREEGADAILLDNNEVLKGAILNESYELTTTFGKLKIQARDVIGLVPAADALQLWLLLADGQAVVGKPSQTLLEVKLTVGSTLKIPLRNIRECGYRISESKPKVAKITGAVVTLRSGERLIWTEIKSKLQLLTSYGKVDLPTKSLLQLEPAYGRFGGHRAVLAGGSVLSGRLQPAKLTLKLKLGPELAIARANMVSLASLTKPVKAAKAVYHAVLETRSGDKLIGRLADRRLTVRTRFGNVEIPPASARTITFDKAGAISAKIWDGSLISGKPVGPGVSFTIAPSGPTVKLPVAQIAQITRKIAMPPSEVIKKIEKRIAQLGAESYVDREKGQKELIAMGKSIVPLLKKYLAETRDPEIRQRLQEIIKALGG